jgi:Zn-finger nucleic acid-binding protein
VGFRAVTAVTIDYCPDCGGVWLDPGELEALTHGEHKQKHKSHDHHDIDVDDAFEEEEEEYEADEAEDGGLLGSIVDALGGEEDGEFEDEEWEEEWGEEEEF